MPARAGHYESFYLKLCHPAEPLGAWIRYTVHKRPGDAAEGLALVHALRAERPASGEAHRAGPGQRGRRLVESGGGPCGRGRGERADRRRGRLGAGARGRRGAALPPAARTGCTARGCRGRSCCRRRRPRASQDGCPCDGREIPVDGWRGMVGHNWGAQHAERWIWLHGLTAGRRLARRGDRPRQDRPCHDALDRQRRAQHRRAIALRWRPGEGHRGARALHLRAVREWRAGAGKRVGAARALRRLGLRGSRRLGAPRRRTARSPT